MVFSPRFPIIECSESATLDSHSDVRARWPSGSSFSPLGQGDLDDSVARWKLVARSFRGPNETLTTLDSWRAGDVCWLDTEHWQGPPTIDEVGERVGAFRDTIGWGISVGGVYSADYSLSAKLYQQASFSTLDKQNFKNTWKALSPIFKHLNWISFSAGLFSPQYDSWLLDSTGFIQAAATTARAIFPNQPIVAWIDSHRGFTDGSPNVVEPALTKYAKRLVSACDGVIYSQDFLSIGSGLIAAIAAQRVAQNKD